MLDAMSTPSARVTAAKTILEIAYQAVEVDDLMVRVAELEDLLTGKEAAAQNAETRRCNQLRQPGPEVWMDYVSPRGRIYLLAGNLVCFAEDCHLPLALPSDLVEAYLAEEDSFAQWRLLQQYTRRTSTGTDQ